MVALRSIHCYPGNSIKSCMDVWSFEQWIWCHTRNGEEQSYMGSLKDASSSGSLSNLVSPIYYPPLLFDDLRI